MKIKKVLFPFFNKERHLFLIDKWWYRLLTVIYIALFVLAFIFLIWYFMNSSNWCFDSLYLYLGDDVIFKEQWQICHDIAWEGFWIGVSSSFVGLLILHYIIQMIFFKIVINFIVLGGNKK